MSDTTQALTKGDGWAAANVEALGEGPGFRKIRAELNVSEMGVNAVILPVGIGSGTHWHDRQEEVYFVHRGTLRFTLGEHDEETVTLGPGGVIRVDPTTQRSIANVGDDEAMYVCVGAAGGYVGRDGHHREGEPRVKTVS